MLVGLRNQRAIDSKKLEVEDCIYFSFYFYFIVGGTGMKKLTKKEKIMIGASIAVGTGLAILGIKQQNKINDLVKQVVKNSDDINEIVNHIENLDQVMPDVIEVIDHVLYPNRAEGGK